MTITWLLKPALALLAATSLLGAPAHPARAETLVGSTFETRVLLAYAVDPAAAQAQLPAGWSLITLGKGPFTGANLIVLLFDQHLILDAQGKPEDPATARGIVTVSYAAPEGGGKPQMFVTNVYSTRPEANPYGEAIAASVARSATLEGPADAPKHRQERWLARIGSGGEIALTLAYPVGLPGASEGEAQPHSAADPEFYRIYRYRQLAELVSSEALGRPLEGGFSFTSTAQELAGLFDGGERLVGATVLPVYLREIYLP